MMPASGRMLAKAVTRAALTSRRVGQSRVVDGQSIEDAANGVASDIVGRHSAQRSQQKDNPEICVGIHHRAGSGNGVENRLAEKRPAGQASA